MIARGSLPSGWVRAKIEDLFATLSDGRTMHQGWSPQCHDEPAKPGEWGVLKTTAIQAGAFLDEHNKALPAALDPRPPIEVSAGDILLTCAGPRSRCGVPSLVRHTRSKLMLSGKMYRFRVPRGVNPVFVESWLLTSEAQAAIDRMKTGGSDSGLNLTHDRFRTLEVVVAPSEEQDRVVEALESYFSRLDAALAGLARVQAQTRAYRASVMNAAVEGRLVPTEAELAKKEKRPYEPASVLLDRILVDRRRRWEEAELARLRKTGKAPKDDRWKAAYQAPPAPDTSKLPQLPDGWCWTSLGQAFNVTVGATPSRANSAYWGGNIPWVSSGEVAFCRITDTAEKITRLGFENSSTKMNPKGSVLLGMIGEGKTRGQVAILDVDACGNQNAAAIWVSQTPIPSEYVYYYLLGQYETTRRRGSGNNQKALNKSRVESIPVPLPPLAEQHRIVERLDADTTVISDINASVQHSLKRASRVRQAILKWAFEGTLVDQDPSDEPAEALLARIRAERATINTTKKPKSGKERLAG